MSKLYIKVIVKTADKPKKVAKKEGLERRYRNKPSKVAYVLQIEKLWELYALEMSAEKKEQRLNDLLSQLSFSIKSKAKAEGVRWNNKRIIAADFESIYYEEAWKLCDNYNHYSDFYFYETLLLVLKRRCIDLTRHRTLTKQGAFEVEIRQLREEAAYYLPDTQVDVEGDTINKFMVEQILNEPVLTEQEQRLLLIKHKNPKFNKAVLAREAGLKHPYEVTRIFGKVKNKLSTYND